MKIKCRIIGFDLDGTLLNSEKHIAEHTREVLTRAVEQGIWILPVTGRPLGGLPKEVVEFPGVQYAITANGARIMETQTGGCLYERLVPVKTAEQIMEIFSDYDALREVYYGGNDVLEEAKEKGYAEAEEFSRVGEYMRSPQMAAYVRATRTPVPDILQLIREKGQDTDKVQGVFKIDEERTEARKRLEAVEGIEVTGALSNNIEVNAAGVDKGNAILWFADHLGIPHEEVAGFGDGNNDIQLLKKAGIGVAMANATDQVKAVSDYITGTNDEDGVATFIEKYIL